MQLAGERLSLEQFAIRLKQFCENEAVDLIPYRNQVGKDAFRRELETFSHHPEDRKEQFWLDAARYYVRKYDEDEVRCQWALPDSWR